MVRQDKKIFVKVFLMQDQTDVHLNWKTSIAMEHFACLTLTLVALHGMDLHIIVDVRLDSCHKPILSSKFYYCKL